MWFVAASVENVRDFQIKQLKNNQWVSKVVLNPSLLYYHQELMKTIKQSKGTKVKTDQIQKSRYKNSSLVRNEWVAAAYEPGKICSVLYQLTQFLHSFSLMLWHQSCLTLIAVSHNCYLHLCRIPYESKHNIENKLNIGKYFCTC